ncbi:hypothetical protein [Salininema proteolyticum]|uniref:Uncharacterized protein n=1 Tax=Salininema proteolyticum TaxID=1607685 RepID=A0ABV8TZ22_9ACTN
MEETTKNAEEIAAWFPDGSLGAEIAGVCQRSWYIYECDNMWATELEELEPEDITQGRIWVGVPGSITSEWNETGDDAIRRFEANVTAWQNMPAIIKPTDPDDAGMFMDACRKFDSSAVTHWRRAHADECGCDSE